MKILSWLLCGALLAGCTADTFASDDGGSDAGADGATPLTCGASTCKLADRCCIYTNNGAAQYQCQVTCAAPQGGAQLSSLGCASSADCLGQACCIERLNGENVSTCASSCKQAQLCDPAAADPGCPASAPCSPSGAVDWGLPSGFGTCGGQGP